METCEEILVIEVTTILPNGNTSTKYIDHNRHEDRVWLGKHCFWAFRNGVEIRTKAKTV